MGGQARRLNRPTAAGCASDWRKWRNRRNVIQAVPFSALARHPSPTHIVAECPRAGVKGRPAPGVRRNPRIPRTLVPRPGSVGEWIPCRTGEVWPPHRAATWRIDETAVVRHILSAVGIGRIERTQRGNVGVIGGRFVIPPIERGGVDASGYCRLAVVEQR